MINFKTTRFYSFFRLPVILIMRKKGLSRIVTNRNYSKISNPTGYWDDSGSLVNAAVTNIISSICAHKKGRCELQT